MARRPDIVQEQPAARARRFAWEELKRQMLATSTKNGKFVVTIGLTAPGTPRNLTRNEIDRLRSTKQAVSARLIGEFESSKKR